ncbi:LOW QUALITY PROTEIN: IQ domain-containing protein M [Morus bassanus]
MTSLNGVGLEEELSKQCRLLQYESTGGWPNSRPFAIELHLSQSLKELRRKKGSESDQEFQGHSDEVVIFSMIRIKKFLTESPAARLVIVSITRSYPAVMKCNRSISSQQLSVPYCRWGPTRTPVSVRLFWKIVPTLMTPKLLESDKCLDLQTQKKVKKNVTHLEVFEASCDSRKHPSSREVLKAVICIQIYVRGWLEHRAFKRVKIKPAGVLNLFTPLRYFELEEWMDKKKSSTAAVRSIKNHQAIEMAFTLFPPLGAKVKKPITVLLWVHPLMNGKDGSEKLAFYHQKSKTDFQVSAALATFSMGDWKRKSPLWSGFLVPLHEK